MPPPYLLTIGLRETYSKCSVNFKFQTKLAPRRVLTKLSEPYNNNNYDNSRCDYICRVSDRIPNPEGAIYQIQERLGHGTFGQVLRCQVVPPGNPKRVVETEGSSAVIPKGPDCMSLCLSIWPFWKAISRYLKFMCYL